MHRLHLIELHDREWFPSTWRDFLTDIVADFARRFGPYRAVAGVIADAMASCGTHTLVDLCSGAGWPAVTVADEMLRRDRAAGLELVLTDWFPNRPALERTVSAAPVPARWVDHRVDAAAVPPGLDGFRTLFTSLHHFRPEKARGVLADAVRSGGGVGAFEYLERSPVVWALPLLSVPLYAWLVTPWLRPFSWRRLLWTYLLPVVPLVALLDGIVSALRTYSPWELIDLTDGLDEYVWEVGRVRAFGGCRVTYLVGVPDVGRGAAGPRTDGEEHLRSGLEGRDPRGC